jgi:polyvinyl alcohol dehydrogenase (cytochrome)
MTARRRVPARLMLAAVFCVGSALGLAAAAHPAAAPTADAAPHTDAARESDAVPQPNAAPQATAGPGADAAPRTDAAPSADPAAAAKTGARPWTPGDPVEPGAGVNARGEEIFKTVCAVCHEHAAGHAPAVFILKIMTPASIYRTLTSGAMRVQAQNLSDADRRAVAEYLAGKSVAADSKLEPPPCDGAAARFNWSEPPPFLGWGLDAGNSRYIDDTTAGIDSHNVTRLKLKWALGFDGAVRARSQPALAGGAIYVGSEDGRVFALDRATGCARWQFHGSAEVRTGVVVSPWRAADRTAKPIAYFADLVGTVYAVDAQSGSLVWRDRADAHPSSTLTATPVLYDGILYVPVSSLEEGSAGDQYDCCTFRGSVVAYEARMGKRLWQTYLVDAPKLVGEAPTGRKSYGPSGIAVWDTPAIDAKRGMLYFATGDNYSAPTTGMSDSIIAMDLKSGTIKWAYQATAGDAWNAGCVMPGVTACPKHGGPDYDFGAATIMASTRGGQVILAGQKSGWVYSVDADTGKLVWKTKVGRGGILAGVYFGMASHGERLFVPIHDAPDGRHYEEAAQPGLYALDIETGKYLWKAATPESVCEGRGGLCAPGIGGSITAVADLVFAGAGDGRLRAYAADSGRVLWQTDTLPAVRTVGGGTASGGSIGGGAGPIAYRGDLIVESGYGFSGRIPGNLMLVFGVD